MPLMNELMLANNICKKTFEAWHTFMLQAILKAPPPSSLISVTFTQTCHKGPELRPTKQREGRG